MPAKPRLEKPAWLRRCLLKCALVLVLVAAFLGGLIWAGRWGLEHLQGRARYLVEFKHLECQPPAGMDKAAFLDEVLYVSGLPQRLDVSAEDLPKVLRDGFAKHPWVEKVNAVEIMPPKQIVVKLTYRMAVLAVKVGAKLRAVDGDGVLLPANAATHGLPIFEGAAQAPQGPAGTRWGDPNVEAAARKLR